MGFVVTFFWEMANSWRLFGQSEKKSRAIVSIVSTRDVQRTSTFHLDPWLWTSSRFGTSINIHQPIHQTPEEMLGK